MMKTKYLSIVLWIAAIYIGSCAMFGCTATGDPDWPAVSREAGAFGDDLRDLAPLFDDAETALAMVTLADMCDVAAEQAGADPAGFEETVSAALDASAALLKHLPDDKQTTAHAVVIGLRMALRRYSMYFGDNSDE